MNKWIINLTLFTKLTCKVRFVFTYILRIGLLLVDVGLPKLFFFKTKNEEKVIVLIGKVIWTYNSIQWNYSFHTFSKLTQVSTTVVSIIFYIGQFLFRRDSSSFSTLSFVFRRTIASFSVLAWRVAQVKKVCVAINVWPKFRSLNWVSLRLSWVSLRSR